LADVWTRDEADPGKEREALRVGDVLGALGDAVGASDALDAATSSRLVRGDLRGAADATALRIGLLEPLGLRPELGGELSDALQMATECAIAVGDLARADRMSRRLLTLPLHADESHLASARAILVACVKGDFDRCVVLGDRFLDGWERAGRPAVNSLAPAALAAACAAEMRGDPGSAADWRRTSAALTTNVGAPERHEMLGFRLLPLLHRGSARDALTGAAALSDRAGAWYTAPFPGDGTWYASYWRPWYAAYNAEAAVLVGGDGVAERVRAARPLVAQNRVAVALVDRAEALLRDDRAALPAIADRLGELQARYQAARTRVMAGGALRARGEAEMRACGAIRMTWPVRASH
jgi:hypothetical protein